MLDGRCAVAGRLAREQIREQTVAGLLDAAAELFAERGVNGTSVEQIAERAGCSRGAFYGDFSGKRDLIVALLEQRTRREKGRGARAGPRRVRMAGHA